MRSTSTSKTLLLWNFLKEGKFTKQDLIEKYLNHNIKLSERTLNYYLSKLKKFINIEIETRNKKNFYYIKSEICKINFTQDDKNAINDIKNLLKIEKKYLHIKEALHFLSRIAFLTDDLDERAELMYYDYYSKLNWFVIKELEKHCKEKNFIKIDYILPTGKNKFVNIHADEIYQSATSDRLYLKGFIDFSSERFSILPIDRIFRIEKIIRKNKRIEKIMKISTFVTSKEKFEEIGLENNEILFSEKDGRVIIKRPVDDVFNLSQRLFNFCPDLYYISNTSIKKEILKKLKSMKEAYKNEIDF